MKHKKYDIIELEWFDSSHSDGWQTEVDIPKDLVIKSVGYFYSENKESITILQSYARDERCFDAIMTIPKVAIIK